MTTPDAFDSFSFFLIIHILNKKNENFHGKMYRLGDMFKSTHFRKNRMGFDYHMKEFPDSIATEYMLITEKENDYNLLLKRNFLLYQWSFWNQFRKKN